MGYDDDQTGSGGWDPQAFGQDPRGAAVSVAVMLITATLVLTVLKKSGFRAMVAVGRS